MDASRTVAVTGASGGVGSRVVRALTNVVGPRHTVVALARDPSRVPTFETGAVRSVRADYEDVDSLVTALDGTSSLIFVSSDGDGDTMLRHHRNIVSALQAADVEHVVYMSIIDIGADSPFYYAPPHRETEALLRGTGISCCFARTSVFADFFFATFLKPGLAAGIVELPMMDGAISLVTRDDVADALAAASVRGMTGEIALTGPAALHRQETADAMRSAAGHAISLAAVDDVRYRRHMTTAVVAPWLIEAFSSMFRSIEEGRFADVSGDVERLVGRPPATFASFLSSHVLGCQRSHHG